MVMRVGFHDERKIQDCNRNQNNGKLSNNKNNSSSNKSNNDHNKHDIRKVLDIHIHSCIYLYVGKHRRTPDHITKDADSKSEAEAEAKADIDNNIVDCVDYIDADISDDDDILMLILLPMVTIMMMSES